MSGEWAGAAERPAGAREREVKLGAGPGFELPDLAGALDGARAAPGPTLVLDATYHDTADLRLARRGVTLRHRTGEDEPRWTLKLPTGTPAVAGGLARWELDVVAPGGDGAPPPAELADLVAALARTAPLVPVARLRSTRRRLALQGDAGEPVAEVDDDEVEVLAGGEVVARFREVEVELAPGAPDEALAPVVAALRGAGAGPPDPQPKLVRALGPRALAPPDGAAPAMGPGATVGELARAALAGALARLVDHDPGTRGGDAEAVHQARVAVRQLRSHLRTFAPALDPSWVEARTTELHELGVALGRVRDLDVLTGRLVADVAELRQADREAAQPLLDGLAADRAARHAELAAALRRRRYLALLDELVGAVDRGEGLVEASGQPAVEATPALVARSWRRLRKAARGRLGPEVGDPELHEVRILAKRARCACEAAEPAIPEAAGLAVALAEVQDVLGEVHDAAVAEAWLRGAGGGTAGAVAAALADGERTRGEVARRAWPEAWVVADRPDLVRWLA